MMRSIDLQDLLSKVQAMQEAYQAVIYQADTDQRYVGLYVNRMFVDRQRQPPQIPPPQEPRIQIDRRKEEEERQREHRRSKVRKGHPGYEEDPSGRIVDMKA
ncbi:MAG: hypothetical protein HY709_11895 [Candidatus Latescibacteria bacterium]|nr:hypothetical protein [Candidatus Latescibacterota bacterium]